MKITCLSTPGSKFGPYQIVYGLAAWPRNSVKNRGWEGAPIVFERPATQAEIDEQKESPRYCCYRYQDWEAVCRDEARQGFDANALKENFQRNRFSRSG